MARKKTARPESISGGYGAIPWSVMDSTSFIGASDKARSLLFALMRQHNGVNNGHLHLAKKWLYAQGWTCPDNNTKSRNELILRGLIFQTKWGGLNMGADLFALTWYPITSYVGLDISEKGYVRGAYSLCNLPATPRRKPPIKNLDKKQKTLPNDRTGAVPATEPVKPFAGTATVSKKALLDDFAGTTIGNNVFIPLPSVKTIKRIVGVKGRSGILKDHPLDVDAVMTQS